MIKNQNTYVSSLLIWFFILISFILPAAFAGMDFIRFFRYLVVFNSIGALFFLINYDYWYNREFNIHSKHNLLKKDLTLFFLLIFGPFGFFPLIYVLIAINDRARGKFLDYLKYVEFSDVKDDQYSLIDITSEFKKQMHKEPVIDSLKYGNIQKKRSAIELLYKMKTPKSIAALKNIARDPEFEIRFFAINKLTALEDEFVNELDWYKTVLHVTGSQPEIFFQYAVMLLKFAHSGLLFPEIAKLYFARSASVFKILMEHQCFISNSVAGLARSLRLSGKAAEAHRHLRDNFSVLNDDGIDELAQCLFELKRHEELRDLVSKVKTEQVKGGKLLKRMIENGESEDVESGDIYSITKLSDCVDLFDKSESLDFDVIFAKIKGAMNSYMLASVFDLIQSRGLTAKIMYLKMIRGKSDPELVWGLKRFLYEKNKLLNLLAADVLASSELPLRNEIFLDLLSHDFLEIKLIAIKFLGMQRVKNAVALLQRMARSANVEASVKTEAVTALAEIRDAASIKGVEGALWDGDENVVIGALKALKDCELTTVPETVLKCLKSSSANVRSEAVKALVATGDDRAFENLVAHYAVEVERKIRDLIVRVLCDQKRPEAMPLILKHAFEDEEGDMAVNNYFTYIGKEHLLRYAKKILIAGKFEDKRFFELFLRFRKDDLIHFRDEFVAPSGDEAALEFISKFIGEAGGSAADADAAARNDDPGTAGDGGVK
ncbi:MAG TPA: HEAT repeat domain-containing protein [Candidatus Wallbacteria bacterium]|nr:HEAT repeat domain-containing protein [Candidatus Wallbacteria bacterium]